jgi:ubiquinone/menaquinone biosynthesis C-methylase UbiE
VDKENILKRIVTTTLIGLGIVGLAACGLRNVQEQSSTKREPASVMSYRGADWLERQSRESEEQTQLIVAKMNLRDGDVVADIGSGTGYFSRKMAREIAPSGRVFAVDIQPQMLKLLGKFARDEGIDNIVPVLGEEADPRLPSGEVDWILLVDAYHEFQQPEVMLERMRDALAPGGRVALAEYRLLGATARHIRREHRMSVEQVLAEWEPAGFELVELFEGLPTQHLFIFKVREQITSDH